MFRENFAKLEENFAKFSRNYENENFRDHPSCTARGGPIPRCIIQRGEIIKIVLTRYSGPWVGLIQEKKEIKNLVTLPL